MLKIFKMDLHIHTCLSPCGDLEMVPSKIVKKAKAEGLDAIGICDHNSAENVVAVKKAGQEKDLTVVGGIEVTSQEEVHILALFDKDENLFELQRIVYENLQGINEAKVFGEQVIVDEKDEILGVNNRLLIGATKLTVDEIVDITHSLKGLVIASHVDRERFSIIGQLGFIPKGLVLDSLEASSKISLDQEKPIFSQAFDFPVVTFSDAHSIKDIGKSSTIFLIEEAKVSEIKKALLDKDGRSIFTYSGHS